MATLDDIVDELKIANSGTAASFAGLRAELEAIRAGQSSALKAAKTEEKEKGMSLGERLQSLATGSVSVGTNIAHNTYHNVTQHVARKFKQYSKPIGQYAKRASRAFAKKGKALSRLGRMKGGSKGLALRGAGMAARGAGAAVGALGAVATAAGVVVGAFAAVAAAGVALTNAFLERAKELAQYSAAISVAESQAEIKRMQADIREAQELGGDYAKLITASNDIEMEIRNAILPIKKFLLENLAVFVERLADLIKDPGKYWKAFMDYMTAEFNWLGETLNPRKAQEGVDKRLADKLAEIKDALTIKQPEEEDFFDKMMRNARRDILPPAPGRPRPQVPGIRLPIAAGF